MQVVCLSLILSLGRFVVAQQPAMQPPSVPLPPAQPQGAAQPAQGTQPRVAPAAQPAQFGPPPGFQHNQLQQAYLDQVLDAWERSSSQINTFSCPFQRWDFNAFKPDANLPYSKDPGLVSYQRPDKGSFQISEVHTWVEEPQSPGYQGPKKGDWKLNKNVIGEHWVCDGESIFEFRPNQKQLVVMPIPPDQRGKSIVDGPLPFLFGAEAAKLKARYWLKIHEQPNTEEIWIVAAPKNQADAANFKSVTIILDRQKLLPRAMQVMQPGGTHVDYIFYFDQAKINSLTDQVLNALFQSPRTPWGWQRVDMPMPGQGGQQPPPRQAQVPAIGQ